MLLRVRRGVSRVEVSETTLSYSVRILRLRFLELLCVAHQPFPFLLFQPREPSSSVTEVHQRRCFDLRKMVVRNENAGSMAHPRLEATGNDDLRIFKSVAHKRTVGLSERLVAAQMRFGVWAIMR